MDNKAEFLKDLKSVTYTEKWLKDNVSGEKANYAERYLGKDWIDILKYREDDTGSGNIKNWLRYRICGELGFRLDCDCDKRVFKIYDDIFKTENSRKRRYNSRDFYINIKDGNTRCIWLETDTMNSFRTIFMQFIRDMRGQDWYREYKEAYDPKVPDEISGFHFIIENFDIWAREWDRDIVKAFNVFAAYTHCLANMILVPKGFNFGGRASATNDYWDLSLQLLDSYKWYCDQLSYDNLSIFLLDDWFDTDSNLKKIPCYPHKGPYGKKLSWAGDQYKKCLETINDRIEKRAGRLAEALPDFGFDKEI